MHSQIIVGGSVRRTGEKRQMLMAAGGAALALAVAAGLGAWRMTERESTGVTTPPVVSRVAGDVRLGNGESPTLYIVGSQAQVDATRAALAEADAIRHSLREGPLASRVLLAGAADVERQLGVITEENHTRAALGLPLIQVVDLRGS